MSATGTLSRTSLYMYLQADAINMMGRPNSRLMALAAALCLATSTAAQADSRVTLVSTGDELLEAINAGDPHIEIIEHLDMRDFPQLEDSFNHEVSWPKPSTLSIRVWGCPCHSVRPCGYLCLHTCVQHIVSCFSCSA